MNSIYKKHVLKSGLRVVLVPDSAKEVVTTMVLVGAGSRYEDEKIAGISHILEHMFYKGSVKRPTSLKVAEFIEDIGGEHNAFTGKEYTGFYTKTAPKHLAKSIDFLSDLLINPMLDDKELIKEKQVILQEYDMYEDLPMEISSSKFEEALFGKNSLGRDVIGYRESIKKTTRDDLIKYKNGFYKSSNIVIVVVGNISILPEVELLDLIEKSFVFDHGAVTKYPVVVLPKEKREIIVKRKTEQTHLTVGFLGAARDGSDKSALKLLGIILGGSMSSRMFGEIREKLGLAYSVHTASDSYLDTGSFDTYAGVPNDRWQEATEAILNEYKKVLKNISEAEFNRAKEIFFGRMLISFEDTNELANLYASNELLLSKIITPAQMIEDYQKITLSEILAVGKKYFIEENMAISLVGPEVNANDLQKIFNF